MTTFPRDNTMKFIKDKKGLINCQPFPLLSMILIGIFGIFIGFSIVLFGENLLMEDYDLYNCIYNNAESNNFNKHPIVIQKIQDECICFREYNYTNLLDVDCTQ